MNRFDLLDLQPLGRVVIELNLGNTADEEDLIRKPPAMGFMNRRCTAANSVPRSNPHTMLGWLAD